MFIELTLVLNKDLPLDTKIIMNTNKILSIMDSPWGATVWIGHEDNDYYKVKESQAMIGSLVQVARITRPK